MSNQTSLQTGGRQSPLERLARRIAWGRSLLAKGSVGSAQPRAFALEVRKVLKEIYGDEADVVAQWPLIEGSSTREQCRILLQDRLTRADAILAGIQDAARRILPHAQNARVFIGHGRSLVWRELKDFLAERLRLESEEFNTESTPGIHSTERLQQMVRTCTFALLVMTADDQHEDQKRHARANVIHEIGLFQGALGFRRAIILREDACEEFSNVHGLTQILFPHDRISAAFEDVRRVLEREGLVSTVA